MVPMETKLQQQRREGLHMDESNQFKPGNEPLSRPALTACTQKIQKQVNLEVSLLIVLTSSFC